MKVFPIPTFRDPAGSVDVRSDSVVRHVRSSSAAHARTLLQNGTVQALVSEGKLVSSEVVADDASGLTIRHPRIPFISYPWEWPPALLLAAADLTLDLCTKLVGEGLILKDATPLNVLFAGTTPVFVDVLSIEPHAPTDSIWLAYAQFIRTFVLPLLAHTSLGWPLSSMQLRRDGLEPEELFRALPWSRRLGRGTWSTVTLPVLVSRATERGKKPEVATAQAMAGRFQSPEVVRAILLARFKSLRSTVHRAARTQVRSHWTSYTATASHYSGEDAAAKQTFVEQVLHQASPSAVLDIGSNTGTFSLLAASKGASVVALDADIASVQEMARKARAVQADILPLHVDIAHPTPAIGWDNRECLSFLERAAGHFDVVLMLAVIHHLLLSSQIPLPHIASMAARLTRRDLVIEWVPQADPMFSKLLRGRDALYAHLTEASFREAFAEHFTVAGELRLTNERVLFHMVKR